jgi:hypothetical protein
MARSHERVAQIDAKPDICDQTLSAADRVAEVWLKDRKVAKLVEERMHILVLDSKSISLLNRLTIMSVPASKFSPIHLRRCNLLDFPESTLTHLNAAIVLS